MSALFEGGCACGSVRYQVTAEPAMVAHCHCTDCQKMTGAHMATIAAVPEAAFTLEKGEGKVYETTGDSGGKVRRSFCPQCGSTLFSTADAMAGMVIIEAGSLDDASWLQPTMHIYTDSAQPWARIPDDTARHPKMPS